MDEIRRIERAYSPKHKSDGYYMLGAFNLAKNLPPTLKEIIDKNEDDVLLVKCTGKRKSQGNREYYIFELVHKFSYDQIPEEYQDHRGQYPNPEGLQKWDWKNDIFDVLGFPIRPWIKYPNPCTEVQFKSIKEEIKDKIRNNITR